MPPKTIVVYSAPGCVVCDRVKDYLKQKGIEFSVRDIVEDESAMDEMINLGVMSTPTTVIDGELVMGFDRRRIEHLLSA